MFLDSSTLIILARVMGPLLVSILAYAFWRYFSGKKGGEAREVKLLLVTYIVTRIGLWLLFATYVQRYVTLSDPFIYYTPMLEHYLAGDVPIRDFFYPYGPLLMPSMLPFYGLLKGLAGISLFAIVAEAIALICFLKCVSLLRRRGEVTDSWVLEALAVYLLNPATLYWTVFQGYHSIVQTAYSMGALYCLLKSRYTTGYVVGLYGIAGSKLLAVLDWPALLAVARPQIVKVLWGAIPLVMTYVIFQFVTGDVFFPFRFGHNYMGEGNIWYLLTIFGDLRSFYSVFPGKLLPGLFFGACFLLGWVSWLRNLQLGLATFSFHAALGVTTFTMSLFFIFSFYNGSYYVPMLMPAASLIVTCPALRRQRTVGLLLLISGFSVAGDAMWASLGQPRVLLDAVLSESVRERWLAYLLTASILVRLACFAMLARLGLHAATTKLYPGDSLRRRGSETLADYHAAHSCFQLMALRNVSFGPGDKCEGGSLDRKPCS
jgi:hypothetical protein